MKYEDCKIGMRIKCLGGKNLTGTIVSKIGVKKLVRIKLDTAKNLETYSPAFFEEQKVNACQALKDLGQDIESSEVK